MIEKEEQRAFSDQLDVLRHLSDIQLRLKKDITGDFVLAKLPEQVREGIIEMTKNAYFAKKVLTILSRKHKRWIWNGKEYKHVEMTKEDKKYINDVGDAIFDAYMTGIYMTVILHRNINENYLVSLLGKYKTDEEREEKEDIGERFKELLKDQGKEK